ncbi:exported hypothetical protein [Candidatus Sulfotelmatobacter kueseliae]|uniref:Uncharacterized protein n=1 Tax=Candidatus Sulfotelmatobacter kueseliae TaxID=2042962 RepID=A0A2U3L0C7_9BACT|nr:exported hypothetical protein [Candidatus Sulfotelmatobacter kueseliae]
MKNLFGAVLLIVAVCAIGQTAKAPQTTKTTPKAEVSAPQSHVGRYQLFFSPHARADVYLVDTETGLIWKPITISNAKDENLNSPPELWVYQERVDSEQEFDVWMAFHKKQEPATTPQQ